MVNRDNTVRIFVESLLTTNRGYSFFVNWNNVKEVTENSIELHAMDSLIRCYDFKNKFYELLDKLPEVITIFPLLFALSKIERNELKKGKEELEIVNPINGVCEKFKFTTNKIDKKLNDIQKKQYYDFFVNMGLKNLFDNIIEKSVTDYVTGVLVGLDSNGRKNRSGTAFEDLCEHVIKDICDKYEITLLIQKKFKVLKDYGIEVNEDIANRKADFILIKDKTVLNIEANYYFAGGSKPEEIVDSYINRKNDLNNNNMNFVLITDGNCWDNKDKNQLNKAFRYIELMNYKMAKIGYLEYKIKKILNLNFINDSFQIKPRYYLPDCNEKNLYYFNGHLQGQDICCYNFGIEKRCYLNGFLQGKSILYYYNRDMEERNYKNGIFQGKSIYYFSNGDIEERYYENGLVQGLAIYKFTNGEVSLRLYNYGSLILESFPENI